MTNRSTRRTVILATGASALLAGCSKYGDGDSSSDSSPKASSGEQLATTSDIPVGGGTIFKEQKIVVTQPAKGDFKAFSAICTHAGCTVNKVADGTIDCPCHGSKFSVEDGAVKAGPAPRPLPAEKITVEGNSIRLA
ncbi:MULTISPECIES: Rieske (2Fe-2S) protein [unclassified Streptomyces]|uniref:Rieske (2Fe-2S) protein n=1 Tax=unclassified Streptomyces TaxID=2593676 RepID=UPI0022535CFF|nr:MULTISPECIES: Rieske (2Fe-2S) protein [unclassified Streptomyces]MCX4991935.1 Rieske (2Fe-2S) protein [Streptomyces sp. NBC_00568]MCX5002829.1 Rieske (2Fe-2S) protein [Streptomyces sp. NBC_00638]